MAVFPMFTNLTGKKCVIIGGGRVASRKAGILLRFGPEIIVIAPKIDPAILEMEEQGELKVIRREYTEGDLKGAALAIAAASSEEVNSRVFNEANAGSIPVNTVDDPSKCTFYFPSVIQRGELTVGISTSGHYPALSKKMRKMLEGIVTEEYGQVLEMLSDFRIELRKKEMMSGTEREIVLKKVIDELFESEDISCSSLNKILNETYAEFLDERKQS